MEIRPVSVERDALDQYEQLFQKCFPGATHLNVRYLHWLYAANPVGLVIGYDAWSGDRLAAHYACIPGEAMIAGRKRRVMLSLNTATHPDFQGKGLFTRLADATYQAGAESGVQAVYGVANANSTPGFVRKLGFALVKSLDARIGPGRIDHVAPAQLQEHAEFHRVWSSADLSWRIANPERPYRLVNVGGGILGAQAPTGKIGLHAWAEVALPKDMGAPSHGPTLAMHLHLGLRPQRWAAKRGLWFDVPQRLRSSPLNMIFRPLAEGLGQPSPDAILLGQLDFDAF